MKTNLKKYQDDLDGLIERAKILQDDLIDVAKGKKGEKGESNLGMTFRGSYQSWYSAAHEVIRQIIPNRLTEFEDLYQGSSKRKILDQTTYTIRDWLLCFSSPLRIDGRKIFNDDGMVFIRFQTQCLILESAKERFKSSLFDISHFVRADLFDSELESARELLKNGFIRPAGAIAGVVAEKHLEEVCHNHKLTVMLWSNKTDTSRRVK